MFDGVEVILEQFLLRKFGFNNLVDNVNWPP